MQDPLFFDLRAFFDWTVTQSPLLAVWLVGGILALVYWRRHPLVSLLALLSVCVCLLAFLLDGLAYVWLGRVITELRIGAPGAEGWRAVSPVTVVRAAQFVVALVYAVAWGLAVGAFFSSRRAPAPAKVAAPKAVESAATPQPAH